MKIIKMTLEEQRLWRVNQGDAREKLKKEWLERNAGQQFRLMSFNGRLVGTVRGEQSAHPSGGSPANALGTSAPSPEGCMCKAFAGTPAGAHHPVCQFRAAWERSRGVTTVPGMIPNQGVQHLRVQPPHAAGNGVVLSTPARHVEVHVAPISTATAQLGVQPKDRAIVQGPAPVQPMVVRTPVMAAVVIPGPATCNCSLWTKDPKHDKTQHHIVCEHYEKYKRAHPATSTGAGPTPVPAELVTEIQHDVPDTEPPPPPEELDLVLVDLETREILRDATGEEIAQASDEEEASGSPFVVVDDNRYVVLKRQDALSAQAL